MLSEFSIEFLGRAGIGERCTESRVVVGLSMGDYVYTKCFVIHLGYRDEHSPAGEERHEFNEHRASFWWQRCHTGLENDWVGSGFSGVL
jgi:hypothetical protein